MTRPYFAKTSLKTLLFATFVLGATAHAQSINPTLDDVFQLRVGPFFANNDTKVTVGGASFDEDALLGENQTTVAGYATWRITPKVLFRFGYSDISRDDTQTLTSGLPVGGITVGAGSTITLSYETSQIPLMLGYAFVKTDRTQLGIMAGANITTLKNSISISAPGGATITPVSHDVTEPLPTLGFFWSQALSPQWMLDAGLGYMGLEIGDIDATIWSGWAAVEWRPFKNVAFGGAYQYNSADGNVNVATGIQAFDYEYSGPFAYLMFGGGSR